MSDDTNGPDDRSDEWDAALSEQTSDSVADSDWDDALNEQSGSNEDSDKQDSYEPAPMDELVDTSRPRTASQPKSKEMDMELILDVPVTISVEIGRNKIPVRNLIQLNQGSVVELDRLAGEPLDVYVNGSLIAHGEVVVVNDKFGVRLTDVISASERVRKLR